jgi:lipopolysaccharide transport system ATP-binding protein
MSRTVIQVEKIGKRYRIGQAKRQTALSHAIGDALRAPARLFRRGANPAPGANGSASTNGNKSIHIDKGSSRGSPYIWALKDVTFDVKEGEVVGLIGRNGAGKSTLLKILARVTRPTEGHAELHGRIGSLLEVGTGFHPELTGRENVFMSGAVLGMRAAEIRRKFDEIVAFSEVERFLDTPLKHYSSGMQMRLAFAVAAHLEPEILFIDEVLAVGDAAFQRKCLGKMSDVARQGRTILFVSHNITAINSLCSRCILMEHGGIAFDGPTAEATVRYYAESMKVGTDGKDLLRLPRTVGNGKARFRSITIQPQSADDEELHVAYPGCNLQIEVVLDCLNSFSDCNLAVFFYDSNGYRVIDTNTGQKGQFIGLSAGQTGRSQFLLREVLLKPGTYFVGLWLGKDHIEAVDYLEHAVALDVVENEESSRHSINYPGVYLCRFENEFTIIAPNGENLTSPLREGLTASRALSQPSR